MDTKIKDDVKKQFDVGFLSVLNVTILDCQYCAGSKEIWKSAYMCGTYDPAWKLKCVS